MAGVVWQLLGDEGMSAMRDTNKFLTDAAPWAMKGDDRDLDRKMVSHSLTHSNHPLQSGSVALQSVVT
jgi:hypothetical protein